MATQNKRLNEAVEDYVGYRAARFAAQTVEQEGYLLRRFAASIGDIQLRHLTPEHVTDWFYGPAGVRDAHVTRDGVHREAVKPSTHHYYPTRLASFFGFATKRGWIRQDLLQDVQPMRLPVVKRQQPSPHMLLAMLDLAQNDRDRAYIATTINTGLRANEIASLCVGDVDLDGGWLLATISKSHEEDAFPITQDLDVELRRWLLAYEQQLGRPLLREYFLFPARKGSVYRWYKSEDGTKERRRTPEAWQPERRMTHTERTIQHALRALGLPTKGEGTHTVRRAVARHFFDSMADDVGYDNALRTVSAMLHHKSMATTEHYLGLSSEGKRRDERLRGQPFLSAMVATENVVPLRTKAE